MTGVVIADTGPVVALLDKRDTWHQWAVETFEQLRPPLLTCESVVTEATFLLRDLAGGADAVMELIDRGFLDLSFTLSDDLAEVRGLMRRYADVPMSLTDACLVRMSERVAMSSVVTLDSGFRIYRRRGRQVIPLIAPATNARIPRRRPRR